MQVRAQQGRRIGFALFFAFVAAFCGEPAPATGRSFTILVLENAASGGAKRDCAATVQLGDQKRKQLIDSATFRVDRLEFKTFHNEAGAILYVHPGDQDLLLRFTRKHVGHHLYLLHGSSVHSLGELVSELPTAIALSSGAFCDRMEFEDTLAFFQTTR